MTTRDLYIITELCSGARTVSVVIVVRLVASIYSMDDDSLSQIL